MRTTVTLDDELLERAVKWSGIHSKSDLLNHVLRNFVQSEAARRLAEMGGSMPDLEYPERGVRYGREPWENEAGMKVAEDEP